MSDYNNTWYPDPKNEKIKERPNFFRRNLWAVISTGIAIIEAIVLIVILVLFRSTASTNLAPQSPSKPPLATVGSTPVITVGDTPTAVTPTQAPTVAPGTV